MATYEVASNIYQALLPGTDQPVVLSNMDKHRSTIFGKACRTLPAELFKSL
jgi:hypothetical protein